MQRPRSGPLAAIAEAIIAAVAGVAIGARAEAFSSANAAAISAPDKGEGPVGAWGAGLGSPGRIEGGAMGALGGGGGATTAKMRAPSSVATGLPWVLGAGTGALLPLDPQLAAATKDRNV